MSASLSLCFLVLVLVFFLDLLSFSSCDPLTGCYLFGSSGPRLGATMMYSLNLRSNTTSLTGVPGVCSINLPSPVYSQYSSNHNHSLFCFSPFDSEVYAQFFIPPTAGQPPIIQPPIQVTPISNIGILSQFLVLNSITGIPELWLWTYNVTSPLLANAQLIRCFFVNPRSDVMLNWKSMTVIYESPSTTGCIAYNIGYDPSSQTVMATLSHLTPNGTVTDIVHFQLSTGHISKLDHRQGRNEYLQTNLQFDRIQRRWITFQYSGPCQSACMQLYSLDPIHYQPTGIGSPIPGSPSDGFDAPFWIDDIRRLAYVQLFGSQSGSSVDILVLDLDDGTIVQSSTFETPGTPAGFGGLISLCEEKQTDHYEIIEPPNF